VNSGVNGALLGGVEDSAGSTPDAFIVDPIEAKSIAAAMKDRDPTFAKRQFAV